MGVDVDEVEDGVEDGVKRNEPAISPGIQDIMDPTVIVCLCVSVVSVEVSKGTRVA